MLYEVITRQRLVCHRIGDAQQPACGSVDQAYLIHMVGDDDAGLQALHDQRVELCQVREIYAAAACQCLTFMDASYNFV